MKRLLLALAVLQVLLVLGIAARIVTVLRVPLPEFGEIPDLPATTPLPPPKPVAKVPQSVTDAVVDHDLFDEARGQNKDIEVEGAPVDATPVPPPTTVKLVGVMRIGKDNVGILVDTNVKPEQQSVRPGDMFGEYQVGIITPTTLNLIGGGGQQFQIPLRIEAGGAGGGARPVPVGAHPGPGGKPPVTPARPTGAETPEQKAATARERAQSIAQRNAELRKAGQKPGGAGEGEKESGGPDPVQARLEALRQLREAAKGAR